MATAERLFLWLYYRRGPNIAVDFPSRFPFTRSRFDSRFDSISIRLGIFHLQYQRFLDLKDFFRELML